MEGYVIVKKKKSNVLGEAFLGSNAYTYERVKINKGEKPPTKGNEKPFNYKLWNTLRRLGRVK